MSGATRAGTSLGRPRSWFVRLRYSRILKTLVTAQLTAAVIILVRGFGWLQPLELDVYDWLRVAEAGHQRSDRVLLVGIDDKDYRRWGYPLPDDDLANLLERIAAWEPRAIAVDLFRDVPVPPDSGRLKDVLARHPNIIWAYKSEVGNNVAIPAPKWLRGSQRAVLADLATDRGNTVRRGLLYAEDRVENRLTLGMALALHYLAQDDIWVGPAPGDGLRLGRAVVGSIEDTRGPYVEPDVGGYQILLDFHGGPDAFRRVSIADVTQRDGVSHLVRGRSVIIGNTADSIHDSFSTPFDSWFGAERQVYGIVIHAHLADQLIRLALGEAKELHALSFGAEMVWILGWGVAGAVLGLLLPSLFWAVSVLLIGLALLAGIVWVAFAAALWLPGLPASLAWVGAAGMTNWVLRAAAGRERDQLRSMFERYLEPDLVKKMLRGHALPQLGGERREISVLFTDVSSFTTLAETMDPLVLAELVHHYFEGVCTAIEAEGGLIDEFIGDAVLALFAAVQDQPDHADRAVAAALAVDAFACQFSALQRSRGVDFGITRIGVHCGMAMVGNLGTRRRLKYGALGDVLNAGSRLEGLNKVIGTRICVSGAVVARCRRHLFRPIGAFVVKGRNEATDVFEPIDLRFCSRDRLALYKAAFEAVQAKRPEAIAQLAGLYEDNPSDPVVRFHKQRLEAGETGAAIVMTEK
jgi:adenylate cyclase